MLLYISSCVLNWCNFFSFDSKILFEVFETFLKVRAIKRTSIHSHTIRRRQNKERYLQKMPEIYPERPFDMRISNSRKTQKLSKSRRVMHFWVYISTPKKVVTLKYEEKAPTLGTFKVWHRGVKGNFKAPVERLFSAGSTNFFHRIYKFFRYQKPYRLEVWT